MLPTKIRIVFSINDVVNGSTKDNKAILVETMLQKIKTFQMINSLRNAMLMNYGNTKYIANYNEDDELIILINLNIKGNLQQHEILIYFH